MRSKVWSANNHCRQAVQAPHGLVSWVAEVSNVAGPRELSSPMWQAHGGRNRFAVRLGLADQTRCPTTQGRWGRNARCACVRILLPRPLTRLLRDRSTGVAPSPARSDSFERCQSCPKCCFHCWPLLCKRTDRNPVYLVHCRSRAWADANLK